MIPNPGYGPVTKSNVCSLSKFHEHSPTTFWYIVHRQTDRRTDAADHNTAQKIMKHDMVLREYFDLIYFLSALLCNGKYLHIQIWRMWYVLLCQPVNMISTYRRWNVPRGGYINFIQLNDSCMPSRKQWHLIFDIMQQTIKPDEHVAVNIYVDGNIVARQQVARSGYMFSVYCRLSWQHNY